MNTTRALLAALLGISSFVALSEREALASTPLVYGNVYNLQNGYYGYQGDYLDTRGLGCNGNDLCVSTSTSSSRDGDSGSWRLVSASGKPTGAPVQNGDVVYLQNMYGGPGYGYGGWLDTRGAGCNGDSLCVSTAASSTRDGGSGSWKVELVSGAPAGTGVNQGDEIRIRNGYYGFTGDWLDTRGAGCQGNQLCVSTSATPDRDGGSTRWKITPATATSGQPFTSGQSGNTTHFAYTTAFSGSSSTHQYGYDFGGGYSAYASAEAFKQPGVGDSSTAAAGLSVPVTLFSHSFDLCDFSASASVSGCGGQAQYEIDAVGAVVRSGSAGLPMSTTLASYSATLFSEQQEFDVGAPIYLSVDVIGTVKLNAAVGTCSNTSSSAVGDGGVSFTLTPDASVDSDFQAGIGFSFASGGVEGSITVVDLSMPITTTVGVTSSQATIATEGELYVTAMSGSVDIYAESCIPVVNWCAKSTTDLFSWGGYTYGKNLFSDVATFNF